MRSVILCTRARCTQVPLTRALLRVVGSQDQRSTPPTGKTASFISTPSVIAYVSVPSPTFYHKLRCFPRLLLLCFFFVSLPLRCFPDCLHFRLSRCTLLPVIWPFFIYTYSVFVTLSTSFL